MPTLSQFKYTCTCMRLTTSDSRSATAIFSSSSHLCLVVYMYPTLICEIRRPIYDSNFSTLGGKKSDDM